MGKKTVSKMCERGTFCCAQKTGRKFLAKMFADAILLKIWLSDEEEHGFIICYGER